jgi:hypothetical protein
LLSSTLRQCGGPRSEEKILREIFYKDSQKLSEHRILPHPFYRVATSDWNFRLYSILAVQGLSP